ncbi:hypothetical protein NM688_g1478 [Phlebia brevispora]|uniref:Uncharacterized protein n=1 Tax=Phlebia brevispora TaxID=194682 RepID=A0ACC1TB70_9APHY|nr:hypothetical protein NM688_g1478 [Phlebia brevispora]
MRGSPQEADPEGAHSTSIVFASATDPYNFTVVDFTGDNEIVYVANITVDGQIYEVQLDTGSSDFWLNTQGTSLSSNVTDTNVTATITYGDTTAASGDIVLAPVQFGLNFSVPQLSFHQRSGKFSISVIYNALINTTSNGLPLLNNIFNVYPQDPNYITFLLGRTNLGISDGGIFTIAEVDSSWSAVVNQSKIAIAQGLGQWIGLMDAVIVNGETFTGHGLLSQKNINITAIDPAFTDPSQSNKTLSVFDTGTALGFMPQYYFDAVYKDVKDLKAFDASAGIYTLPCDTKLNVSMVFNGTEYPINPIDMTRLISVGNETSCITTFAPKDLTSQGIDFVLGDAFLRNVYTLFNYGNWTDEGSDRPYVQLLSTTNQSEAWAQYDDLNDARISQWQSLNGTFSPQ